MKGLRHTVPERTFRKLFHANVDDLCECEKTECCLFQVVEAVLLKTIQSVFILNSCWRRWKGSDERPQMKEHSVLNAKMELRCLHGKGKPCKEIRVKLE